MPLSFPSPDAFADLIRLAMREDLGDAGDVTSNLTVPADRVGLATFVQKSPGVIAGLPILEFVAREFDERLSIGFDAGVEASFSESRRPVARVRGPLRSLLAAERTMLNFVQRISGVATLARRYVEAVGGTKAQILDTRKTIPGWRALDKYAVRAGGGANHRVGLFDMVLVKDNHLAQLDSGDWAERLSKLVAMSRDTQRAIPIEVEVDTPEQFEQVVAMPGIDIVLLDNMPPETMARCVARRDAVNPTLKLESSGGVNLGTVAAIARSGVDRISVGALTHSAPALDIGLDLDV